MSNSKSELIERHRKQLISRLLARNPLLHFRPYARSNRKIDICDFFNTTLLESHNNSASNFFERLVTDDEASVDLSDSPIIRQIKRMKVDADNLRRATGMQSLFWTWPFVRIPRKDRRPLVAPLLFWRIEMNPSRQKLSIKMSDKTPAHNEMLQSWLKNREILSLDFSGIVKGDGLDMPVIIRRINKIADQWNECTSMLKEDKPYQLFKYPDDNDKLEILPCAVLGIANFKYWALLSDLDKLIEKAKSNTGCGLLDEFLGGAPSVVRVAGAAKTPDESERYMVETSDVSQEHAVWKSRESQIMLLDGPPGTGKSQTIVNLVADALKRKESVALICHKPAALDVVKKRLGAVKLNHLTVKITDPRIQNKGIIDGIKHLVDNNDEPVVINNATDARSQCINEINGLEKKCELILASRGTNGGLKYSIRGHLRGKIEDVRERTEFSPYNHMHDKFVTTIFDIAKTFPDNEDEGKRNKDKLAEFVKDYKECNFDKNLWRQATSSPKDFLERFQELVRSAEKAGNDHKKLPTKRLMSFLSDAMMRKYAHTLFHGDKKSAVRDMLLLITATMDIFAEAGMPAAPSIWKAVYQGGDYSRYQSFHDDAQHLETAVFINKQLQTNKIIQEFMGYKERTKLPMRYWPDVLESIFCKLKLAKIPSYSITNEEKLRHDLGQKIKEKRDMDVGIICRGFPARQKLAGELKRGGWLIGQGRRSVTVRRICHRKWEEFHGIYPVLLLNPDSMCQILPLEPEIIDLAIVDEASQMFVADVLPILYRAKKIVISGDNMQMPPDVTFSLQDDNDNDDESEEFDAPPVAVEEVELMEATKRLLTNSKAICPLNVHYRSRSVELIAFSNHAFYNGRLQAATSNNILPEPLKCPIQVIHVAGNFQNGVNREEITEIIKCLEDIWDTDNPPSIGVIVFNVKQKKLLEDELSRKCEESSEFREKYEKAKEQKDGEEDVGFFARSVEHVQGDERDIIILATTYNNAGTFGSLTIGEKGRRRLNVAVTRAKHGMLVITSFEINNISNEGQRPEGSHAGNNNRGSEKWYVWKFMMYARAVSEGNREAAAKILQSINSNYDPRPVGQEAESQFEKHVGDFIQDIGYAVDYQVGEGGFRIDLGIKKNKEDKRYLCGIECDGRYWHEGWRARHNDGWRQDILEDKGWKIYRIWSDHWYKMPDQTQKNLFDYLKK